MARGITNNGGRYYLANKGLNLPKQVTKERGNEVGISYVFDGAIAHPLEKTPAASIVPYS